MSDKSLVRVRFAPSPTGMLHIGGVRTALFNYLFARANKGTFILRLEDTDRERFVEGGIEQIQKSLQWVGLVPDEGHWFAEHKGEVGPYLQSERLPHYLEYAKQLVAEGKAYYSRISSDDFSKAKTTAIEAKKPFVYKYSMEPVDDGDTKGYPIRLRVPNGETKWSDEVRGEFNTSNDLIDDFVLIKADGFPTYNFANVADDHLMKISHVIRGDEFIPSTAKHALLYDLFDWQKPKFIHLPPILGPDGKKKLSKRDGDVDILSYKQKGYLPEALVNFLALLGWNDGTTQEVFSGAELVEKFSLDGFQKSPAAFDIERLNWLNGIYIRNLPTGELVSKLAEFLPKAWYKDEPYLKSVIELDKERFKTLAEVPNEIKLFFEEPSVDEMMLISKTNRETTKKFLDETLGKVQDIDFSEQAIEDTLRALCEQLDVKPGELFFVIRVAITGQKSAPGLFETMATLGKERVIMRLTKAKSQI